MSLQTLLATAFVLGVVVVVHEAGHFLVAKAVGIYCKTFSIGFGPKLLRKRIGETEYAISALPLGGYVKMAGEGAMEDVQDLGTGDEDVDGAPIDEERFFSSKNVFQRMAVVLAGPAMNLVLAFVVMIGLRWAQGVPFDPETRLAEVLDDSPAAEAGLRAGDRLTAVEGRAVASYSDFLEEFQKEYERRAEQVAITVERDGSESTLTLSPNYDDSSRPAIGLRNLRPPVVGKVKQDGPAERAGLREGDLIIAVDGQTISDFSQIATIVNDAIGRELELRWTRDGQEMFATVVPEEDRDLKQEDGSPLGRIFFEPQYQRRQLGFAAAAALGSREVMVSLELTLEFLGRLVRREANREDVSGPLRIAQFAGQLSRWGFDRLLQFVAFLSVNLCVLNLLPIPVLDGGHAVFILYEMILGRRPNRQVQMWATQLGLVLLLVVMAFVLTQDILHTF